MITRFIMTRLPNMVDWLCHRLRFLWLRVTNFTQLRRWLVNMVNTREYLVHETYDDWLLSVIGFHASLPLLIEMLQYVMLYYIDRASFDCGLLIYQHLPDRNNTSKDLVELCHEGIIWTIFAPLYGSTSSRDIPSRSIFYHTCPTLWRSYLQF